MEREVTLEEMLEVREARAHLQQLLMEQYALPVISFSLNIAGPVKKSPIIRRTFQEGMSHLADTLRAAQVNVAHQEQVDQVSIEILYQDENLIIVVEKGSPATKEELDDILKEYVPVPLERRLVREIPEPDPLTDEETALKTLLNSIGYDIQKINGRYSFLYGSGFAAISTSDLNELLSCAQNGLKIAAKTLELKVQRRFFDRLNQPTAAPEFMSAPRESTDTAPPSDTPETPPEGEE